MTLPTTNSLRCSSLLAAGLALGNLATAQAEPDTDRAPGAALYPDQLAPSLVESGHSMGTWHQDGLGSGHASGIWRDHQGIARYAYDIDMYPGILYASQAGGGGQNLNYRAVRGVVYRYGEPATSPPVDPSPVGWLEGQFVRAEGGRGHFRAHVYDPTITDPLLLVPPIGFIRGVFAPVQDQIEPRQESPYVPLDPTLAPGIDPGVSSPGGGPAINDADPDTANMRDVLRASSAQWPDRMTDGIRLNEISGMEPGYPDGLPALFTDRGHGFPSGEDPISTVPGGGGLTFTAQGAGQMGSVGASLTRSPMGEEGLYLAGWSIWG